MMVSEMMDRLVAGMDVDFVVSCPEDGRARWDEVFAGRVGGRGLRCRGSAFQDGGLSEVRFSNGARLRFVWPAPGRVAV